MTVVGATERLALAESLAAAPSAVIRRLAIGCTAALVLISAWSIFVPIASGAVAPGQLAVENRRKTLQHMDGGIIQTVAVREGSRVRAGDLLIRLNDNEAQLNVKVLQTQVDSLRAEEAVRLAELSATAQIAFPADLLARSNDPDVALILEAQRTAFKARRSNASGRKSQLAQKSQQFGNDMAGANAQMDARETQIALMESELRDLQALFEKGYVTKGRILALQRAIAQTRGDRSALGSEAEKLRSQAVESRIGTRQVDREASTDAANALREIRNELVQSIDKLAVARQILARTEIRAPVAGTVVGLQLSTIGGVIRPGEALLDIVPETDRLVVSARIPPMHADDVRIGQPAFVRFDAAGTRNAPMLEGRVLKLSADALTDSRTGTSYFEAVISIPDNEAGKLPKSLLKPGLPAEVLMKTGERTALAYLLAPLTRATFHAMRE